MRRLLTLAAATAAMLLAVAGPAIALQAGVVEPAEGSQVGEPIPIRVRVAPEDCAEDEETGRGFCVRATGSVTVGLAKQEAAEPVGQPVTLECVGIPGEDGPSPDDDEVECEREPEQIWGGVTFEPATGAPFLDGGAPTCNGGWYFEIVAQEEGRNGDRRVVNASFVISVPAPAPQEVAVEPGPGTATVTWRASGKDPDLLGFRVQRRTGEGEFTTVAELKPDARSYTDDEAPTGKVDYRVVALAADGRADPAKKDRPGKPAVPCKDAEHSQVLTAASQPVTATVEAEPGPTPDPTQDQSATPGPTESSTGSGGGTDQTAAGAGGTSTETDQSPSFSLTVPEPDPTQTPIEDPFFYGENLGFNEELDYSGTQGALPESILPDSAGGPDTVTLRDAGGGTAIERYIDPQRIAVPVAAGLLLVAVGLHLRLWMNGAVEGLMSRSGGNEQA